MFPLYDENPTKTRPYVTWILIAANVVVFVLQLSRGFTEADFFEYGAVPNYLMRGERLYTLFTSMFMHGGFLHIIGNMLYLFIFGDNVEDRFGHVKFLILYLVFGVASGIAHSWIIFQFNPSVAEIPAVGASGAISGVLGAYILFYPRANIVTLVFLGYFATTAKIKSIFYLGIMGNGLSQLYYWRLLSKSLIRYRKSFRDAIAIMVFGHHFRKVSKKL